MTTFAIHELLTAAQLVAAHQALDSLPKGNFSAATEEQYRRQANRLLAKLDTAGEVWSKVKKTRKKPTYHFRVASLKYGLHRHLHGMLHENTYAQETPEQAQADLHLAISLLEQINANVGAPPLENTEPRHSKRQALQGLPHNWRLTLYKRFAQGDNKYALPLAVTAITGCRPSELKTGVELRVTDGVLTCKILGAKVKNLQGQPERHISYEIDSNPFVEALASAVARQGTTLIQVASDDAFRQAVIRAGGVLWPRKKETVTPYCLRHAAASDFKACMSEEEVSEALGHFSADTKRLYGQRQMSRSASAVRPISVQATRPIKTPKADRQRNRRQF